MLKSVFWYDLTFNLLSGRFTIISISTASWVLAAYTGRLSVGEGSKKN